ncbi:ATP-binding cassette domain-containing protein [Saccharopolyspora spinosa]|uniref:ABC-type transport system involved in cytochrome bd biosynthesis fused ATPase/permease subunit n=1 Tax=Saccharopolyspora spinosa TaxID=60894 RepID=A0A2N3XSD6_SACSN|nr:ATP-binding cassette domain-containing protein [Saccharopolyspora spinosa]PKW13585.1 ABC-type transport system involved in cytochrome bd biosynthesis fused ATPase/permease subunit [Saccharopolyspora spinosa]
MGPLGALPRLSGAARRALVVAGLLSVGNAVALIMQAWALGSALAAVVTRGAAPEAIGHYLVVLAAAVVARAVLGWATETVSARAAAGAKEELRGLLLDSALRQGPEWIQQRGPAELTALATKGLDSLDAYFTKYLPALVTAAVVPPLVGAWILFSDWVSALVVVITVPLIPLFAWLVGKYTEQRTSRAADAVQRLSGQLLELIRALPVLTAFGRAQSQGEVVRRVSDTHRRTTIATLRIAFLSALVLELLSSLSVAMVAVGIGLRLVSGDLDLATGLLVLVLAPECYLPLRAAGAAHHASEDGVEAVRRVDEIVNGRTASRRGEGDEANGPFTSLDDANGPFASVGGANGRTASRGEGDEANGPFTSLDDANGPFASVGGANGRTASRGEGDEANGPFTSLGDANGPFASVGEASGPFASEGVGSGERPVDLVHRRERFVRADSALRVTGLRVRRRGGFAPDGLSFVARSGEIVRLEGFDGIGPSGSGKSTTMAVLLGFAAPEEGAITWGGVDITELDAAEWRRRIAWVPQRPTFTGGTVADELAVATADQPDLTAHVDEALSEAAAAHLRDRRIDELSTGERQRVAVARALLRLHGEATILLLDEPTAHLDAATAHQVNAAIRRAADTGATVVLASHRPEAVATELEAATAAVPAAPPDLPAATGRIRDLITPRTLLGVGLGALSLLSGLALTATSAWLIARASQQPPILTLSVAVVGVRTFALSRAVLRYADRLVTHDAAFRLSGRLRRQLWEALVRLGPVRTAGLRRGEGVARLVDDVDTVRDLEPRVILPPLVAAVVVVAAVVLQALVLPEAGLALAAALLVAFGASPLAALAAERRATTAVAEGRRRVAARVLALLDGSAELLAFGAHTERRAELAAADEQLAARARRAAFGAGAATAVNTLLVGIAVLGGAWFGATAVAEGRLAPELAPLLGLVPLAAAEAVALLPPAAQQWQSLRAAQARLAPLLAAGSGEPQASRGRAAEAARRGGGAGLWSASRAGAAGCEVASEGGGAGLRSASRAGAAGRGAAQRSGEAEPSAVGHRGESRSGATTAGGGEVRRAPTSSAEFVGVRGDSRNGNQRGEAEPSSGGVELAGVDVRWPGAAELALRGVDLRVPDGAHVAVVGPSGGGKSTFLALLLGFLGAERGAARVPQWVAWCPQEPQLVSTTIRENLRLAAPHASDQELGEALRLAGLPGWDERLDELVGSGGAALSGGEAQRLALARALLFADADLMLLDEPTAHLDVPTAEELLVRLRSELRGRTVVHVTHRWSETEHADIVLRVEGGEITVVRNNQREEALS